MAYAIGDIVLLATTLSFLFAFYRFSPASKSAKLWTIFYSSLALSYLNFPVVQSLVASSKSYAVQNPLQATIIALTIAAPLKYLQRKLRYARLNTIKWKYGFTDDPATYENMTVEQAQEVERNLAEWEFPRLFQWGWISDFFRTSTDPGVARAITASGHFINEDKRIEHQRMQATVHMMTGIAAYPIKSPFSSLVIARINEHHHRYGIKINSDDVLYLIMHFGMAPAPWINKFGYRKLEPFEEHAMWTLWREIGCRFGVKYIPKTMEGMRQWRKNFEETFRWREEANEKMATAMLDQVLYAVPPFLRGFVRHVFVSIVDWDIVYFCRLEKYHPSPVTREIVHDIFRLCGWFVREFGLPRLSPYIRSPDKMNKDGKITFPHTPYDTMPWWQEASLWNLYGPRAIFTRLRGMPLPSAEYQSEGVPFESMGAPHPHPATQSLIEKKVRENAAVLEEAPIGYRPAVGFQARRLLEPVEGEEYGDEMNRFPKGTPTTPNNPSRFTREYERRGGIFTNLEVVDKPEDVLLAEEKKPEDTKLSRVDSATGDGCNTLKSAPTISAPA